MNLPTPAPISPPATPTHDVAPAADNTPPTRSKITGGLAALACAACCAIPLLITAGVLTGAGAALLEQTVLAIAAGLAVTAGDVVAAPAPQLPPGYDCRRLDHWVRQRELRLLNGTPDQPDLIACLAGST